MKEKKKQYLLCCVIGITALLFLDQLTKHLARVHLKGQSDRIWIPNVFQLHYLENRGAAFGLFQNQKVVFLVLCVLFLIAVLWFLRHMPAIPYYLPLYVTAAGLFAGAAGNGIDRAIYGYVTDFFYFSLIDFPVFNMADIYVVVSGIFLILYVGFFYKEEDLAFLWRKKADAKKRVDHRAGTGRPED